MDPEQNGGDDETKEKETEKKDVKQTYEDTANLTTKEQNENKDVKTTSDDTTNPSGIKDVKEDPNRDIKTGDTENSVSESCQKDAEEITPNAETNNDQVDEPYCSSSITADGEASNGLEGTINKTATATDEKCQNETPGLVADEDEVTQQIKKCKDTNEVGQREEIEENTEQPKQDCQAEVLKQSEEKEDEARQQKEEDQGSTEEGQQKVKGHDAREAGMHKDERDEKSRLQNQGGKDTTEAGKQKEKIEGDDTFRQQTEEGKDEAGQTEKEQATTKTIGEKEERENEDGQPIEEGQNTTGVTQGKDAGEDTREEKEESQNETEEHKQEGLATTEAKKQKDKNEDNDGQQREVGQDLTNNGQQREEKQDAAEALKQKEELEDEAGRQKDEGIYITEEQKDTMKGKSRQKAVETSCSETQTGPEITVDANCSREATEQNTGPNISDDEKTTDQQETTDEQKLGPKADQQAEHEQSSKQKENEQKLKETKSPENNIDEDIMKDTCDENNTDFESKYVQAYEMPKIDDQQLLRPKDDASTQSKDLLLESGQDVTDDSRTSQKEAMLNNTTSSNVQCGEGPEHAGQLIGNNRADFDNLNKVTQSKAAPEHTPEEDVFQFTLSCKGDVQTMESPQDIILEMEEGPPIAYLLEYCEKCEPKFIKESELETLKTEYADLVGKANNCGYRVSTKWPPSTPNAIINNDQLKNPSSSLQNFILRMNKQSIKRCDEALTEYIEVSTYALKEHTLDRQLLNRQRSHTEEKKKKKKYSNCLEKLLDIDEKEWHFDEISKHSVESDHTHLRTAESVLKSYFPKENVLDFVKINISSSDQVPLEYHHRALFKFLVTVRPAERCVNETEMWKEFGRLIVAERQLDLARRAVGPDLDKNVIVDKKTYHKLQDELKAKIDEVEELSTRLSRFASQQLTEGNPNIADLSDTHRPTRLGEMYSQLFDDEWSEAFEAFKPKYEDDEDIFPDTLFILQNLLMKVFEFCKIQSKKQMFDLEKTLAKIIGIGETCHIDSSTPVDSETLLTGDNDKGQSSETDISKSQGEKAYQCHKDSDVSNDETKSERELENVPKEEQQKVDLKEKDINADDHAETTENQNEQSDELKQNTFDKNESSGEQTKETLSINDEDLNDGSEKDIVKEEDEWESREKDQTELMIERHARDFRKAAATPSAISKAKAFIEFELPKLVDDKEIREDERTVTYINKCVELCWYMCMQDPPMTIVSPSQGETIDKAEFSHHGRRGKFVETCVWPALLLHEKGPLVCKGYVLPQSKKK